MKKHESIVWLPPRSIGERAFASDASLLALVQTPEGPAYSTLSLDALPAVRSVRLIFDARDVTLLHVKLPPLSGAKLRQAIPNVIEDRVLQDTAGCAFALGPADDAGRRLIAVLDRSWFEFVLGAFERRGLRVAAAWPAQLVAPLRAGELPLICVGDGIAIRTGERDGLGWTAGSDPAEREQAFASLLATVLAPPGLDVDAAGNERVSGQAGRAGKPRDDAATVQAGPADGGQADETDDASAQELAAVVAADMPPAGESAVGMLHVRRVRLLSNDPSWREPLVAAVKRLRVGARAGALPVPESAPLDLLAAAQKPTVARRLADLDWRAWRLPMWLAGAGAAVFLVGLNLHWGKLSAEKRDLRAGLETQYRQAFPNDRVVVDPLLQMERNVAKLRASAGQSGPDDFLPMLTRFAQALGPQVTGALTGVEYRDGRLKVTFEPTRVAARSVREQMAAACQRLGLALRFEPGREQSAVVGLL
ncbi:MAG: type II secretion system protein GspL [Burkholderiaceae bacterium]